MEIKLTLPPGTKAEVVKDKDDNITGFTVVPFFHSKRATSTVILGQVVNAQDKVLDEFSVTVSGVNGAISNNRREFGSAIPLADLSEEERKAAEQKAESKLKKSQEDSDEDEDEVEK